LTGMMQGLLIGGTSVSTPITRFPRTYWLLAGSNVRCATLRTPARFASLNVFQNDRRKDLSVSPRYWTSASATVARRLSGPAPRRPTMLLRSPITGRLSDPSKPWFSGVCARAKLTEQGPASIPIHAIRYVS